MSRTVQRPVESPRRRGAVGTLSFAPLVAAALIVAVGIAWLGGRETRPDVGASPAPSEAPSAPAVAESGTPEPASPAPAACTITVAITSWEGAAGSRIANLTAKNEGAAACVFDTVETAQLIDGRERVLAQTGDKLGEIWLEPGESVQAMASVSNVCADAVAPVTIRLKFAAGGSVDATPLSPEDGTVPPCNGPGQPSEMDIRGWRR